MNKITIKLSIFIKDLTELSNDLTEPVMITQEELAELYPTLTKEVLNFLFEKGIINNISLRKKSKLMWNSIKVTPYMAKHIIDDLSIIIL